MPVFLHLLYNKRLLFILLTLLRHLKQCSFINFLQLITCNTQRSSDTTQRPFHYRRVFVLAKKDTNAWVVSLTSKQLISS